MLDLPRIAAECFGLDVTASRPLPGYEDLNARITARDGRRYVLKVSAPGTTPLALEGQNAALEHLARVAPELPVPRVVSAGERTVLEHQGRQVRLLTWLEGEFLADVSVTPALMASLGSTLGRMDAALLSFSHPGLDRTLDWDLLEVLRECQDLDVLTDPWRRDAVEHLLCELEQWMPDLLRLRRGVIHNDPNDHNLLVEEDRVVGVIDFGDMVSSALAGELAVAATYAMMDAPDPGGIAADLVGAYHRELPLQDAELAAVYPLVCARLCLSVVHSARAIRANPENTYITVSEAPAWRLIRRLLGTHPEAFEARLRAAVGLEPGGPSTVEGALARRHHHLSTALSLNHDQPLKIGRGVMQHLYDESGKAYLDLVNNVCHVGHANPRVVRAGARQMARLNTNTRYLHDHILHYAERLLATLPAPLEVCFLVCSGSEANELALRLAQTYTGRREVMVVDHAYHGNTDRLVQVSPYKFAGPGGAGRPDWVRVLPTPDPYRGGIREPERADQPVGAFLTEAIMACAGQVVPARGFLSDAFARVRAAGGVCISDEVQVGFGRVGAHFWGFELHDVVPDIVTLGKPIGNGHPLAAVVTTREIAAAFDNGMEYFNTFGGNPVSCAIGLAVLDEIADRGLQERALRLGERFMGAVRELGHPAIGEVRGSGLFLGVELIEEGSDRVADGARAQAIVECMKDDGVLMSTEGPGHNVLKIKPPLVVTAADLDRAVDALSRALGATRSHV